MILIGYILIGLIVAGIRWGLLDDFERSVDGGFFSFLFLCFWPFVLAYWILVAAIMLLGIFVEELVLRHKQKSGDLK